MIDDHDPDVSPAPDAGPDGTAPTDPTVRFRTRRSRSVLVVAVVIALGAFLRVWALGRQPVNADEAVVGLMAHQILHGHFSAFYWAQSYGGVEPYVVAAVFAVVGQSAFSLGLTPVLLAAVAAILTWRIGRRLFPSHVAVAAGLVVWVWPEVFLWQSTIEYGFRFVVLDAGLAGVLCALDLMSGPGQSRRRLDWIGIGLFFGIGWWASPEIVYFAVPTLAVLLVEVARRALRVSPAEMALGIVAAAVGALPWIVANVASGGASLHSGPQPDPSYLSHLRTLGAHVVPIYLGLALPVSGRFVVPHLLGRAIEYGVVAAGVVACAAAVQRRSRWVLVAMAVCFPFFYAASPATWYWQDGRYAIYLAPIAALLAVFGADRAVGWIVGWHGQRFSSEATDAIRRVGVGVLVGLLAVVTVVDARLVAPFHPGSSAGPAATWTSWHADATRYASSLADGLGRAGITGVIAGYWIAEPVTLVSGGAVTASDVRYDRQPRLLAEAEHRGPAYLFVRPSRLAAAAEVVGSWVLDPGCAVVGDRCLTPALFGKYLASQGIAARRVVIGNFVAIVPSRFVSPAAVFRAAGIPI